MTSLTETDVFVIDAIQHAAQTYEDKMCALIGLKGVTQSSKLSAIKEIYHLQTRVEKELFDRTGRGVTYKTRG